MAAAQANTSETASAPPTSPDEPATYSLRGQTPSSRPAHPLTLGDLERELAASGDASPSAGARYPWAAAAAGQQQAALPGPDDPPQSPQPQHDEPPVPRELAPYVSRAAGYSRVFSLDDGPGAGPAPAAPPAAATAQGWGIWRNAAGAILSGLAKVAAPAAPAPAPPSPQPPTSGDAEQPAAAEVPTPNATPQDVVIEKLRNRNRKRPPPTLDSPGRTF